MRPIGDIVVTDDQRQAVTDDQPQGRAHLSTAALVQSQNGSWGRVRLPASLLLADTEDRMFQRQLLKLKHHESATSSLCLGGVCLPT